MVPVVETEEFAQRVRRLAEERGLSMSRLLHDAWDPHIKGTSPDLARKVISGRRALTPTLIEAVAKALDVPPEEFPEYRLAMARRQLDEAEVGLDQALASLERLASAGQAMTVSEEDAAALERAAAEAARTLARASGPARARSTERRSPRPRPQRG